MKRKICFALCAAMLAAAAVFADDLEMNFSAELKTGLLWEKVEEPGVPAINKAQLGNNDDAGIPGRIRLDGELLKDNLGLKMRWETNSYRSNISPNWAYVYAYGDFINDQLRLSGGRLGQSPWSSGGPEIWTELDNRAGLRVEVKPNITPGLNVGFVLNEFNKETGNTEQTLQGILQESIVGASYTHEYFHIRAAYRFDSDEDSNLDNMGFSEGHDFMYRVEERVLRNFAEGLSIWANGHFEGILTDVDEYINYINWLYVQYNFSGLNAQLRTGFDVGYKKYVFKLKPVITYAVTSFLMPGFTFIYEKDSGEAAPAKDAPYKTLAFEPMIRVVLTNMYVDLAYRFMREYRSADRIRETNWINLRFVYTF